MKIGQRPVVTDLRQHDQIEAARRDRIRDLHALHVDLRQAGAALAGARQRGVRDVHRQQITAARGQLGGQDADRAANLESPVVFLSRQRGQRGGVLGALVVTGFEQPGVGVGGVDLVEVGRLKRIGCHGAT